MCGRFVQTSPLERLAVRYGAIDVTATPSVPRYNVAPSTPIPAIIATQERRLGLLSWGYVPSWSRSPQDGPRPINARVEGAAESRLFAPALARRRCIVPIDAWYEWTEEAGTRQPWLLRPRAHEAVAVAALWSTWRPRDAAPDVRPLGTVALMTTEASGPAATVHHRMPLIVPDALVPQWLDPMAAADASLLAALRSAESDLEVVRVSRRVNDVRNDGPELLDPIIET